MVEETGSWESIRRTLEKQYPDQEPNHFGQVMDASSGGNPLDGISVFDAGKYLHYITYGISEIYEKWSRNLEWSGWGFEFSLKVSKEISQEAEINMLVFLKKMARYVYEHKVALNEYHFVPFGEPIFPEISDHLTSMVFCLNEQLGLIETPTGKLKFLDIYFISQEDNKYCWSEDGASEKLVNKIRDSNKMFVNDFNALDWSV